MSPQVAVEAIRIPIHRAISASWLYPLKGIIYFLSTPSLYPLFARRILPLLLISILILTFLFTFTYLPQVALLAIFQGRLAFFNACILVLGEGSAIIALLFEALMVDETLVDIFDSVLIQKGFLDLVSPSRVINLEGATAPKMLGRPVVSAVYSPFSFRQIAEFIIFLPLNLVPVIGTPFFLVLTGARGGPFHHWRYFRLLGLNKKERKEQIRKRKWKYTWFGTVSLALQLVPVLSMFFLLTTAAGSALWAAQLEEQRRLLLLNPDTEEEEEDRDPPPEYTDAPV